MMTKEELEYEVKKMIFKSEMVMGYGCTPGLLSWLETQPELKKKLSDAEFNLREGMAIKELGSMRDLLKELSKVREELQAAFKKDGPGPKYLIEPASPIGALRRKRPQIIIKNSTRK